MLQNENRNWTDNQKLIKINNHSKTFGFENSSKLHVWWNACDFCVAAVFTNQYVRECIWSLSPAPDKTQSTPRAHRPTLFILLILEKYTLGMEVAVILFCFCILNGFYVAYSNGKFIQNRNYRFKTRVGRWRNIYNFLIVIKINHRATIR